MGILVLALLVALAAGYWYLTNDRRVTAQATQYLQTLTGGRVTVANAHFSLFGGIQIRKVNLYLPSDSRGEPFFSAKTILLKHRPLGLLRGRLEPTEVTCLGPVVTLVRDMRSGNSNLGQLMPMVNSQQANSFHFAARDLPSIVVRDCLFRFVSVEGTIRSTQQRQLTLSLIPSTSESCRIVFESQRSNGHSDIEGSIDLNLQTGEMISRGQLPIRDTVFALPQKYLDLLNRYEIDGAIRFNAKGAMPQGKDAWNLELIDASLKLPDAQGGLRFGHVNGELSIDPAGVTITRLAGTLGQAGGGSVTLSGRYDGLAIDSPFTVQLTAKNLSIPKVADLKGDLAARLLAIEKECTIAGRLDAQATIQRDRNAKVTLQGQLGPQDMEIVAKYFPYRLEHLGGKVDFDPRRISLEVTGLHGQTRLQAKGVISLTGEKAPFDITVQARDLKLDDDLRSAMNPNDRRIFDGLSPRGELDLAFHLFRKDGEAGHDFEIALKLDGRAGLTYDQFPYPAEQLAGSVTISANNSIVARDVTGKQGPMRCQIDGAILHAGQAAQTVDLKVTAWQMPLDNMLASALGPHGKEMMGKVAPAGVLSHADARITQAPGKPLVYDVTGEVSEVSLKPKDFPYAFHDAAGTLRVTPGLIEIKSLKGRHGQADITTSGKVLLNKDDLGLDLTVTGKNIRMDREFHAALPPQVQGIWKQLSPSGAADIELALKNKLPDQQELWYSATIAPKGMGITYADFPYPFGNVTGEAVATPGRVELKELRSVQGDLNVTLSGTIITDRVSEEATLAIGAKNMPIDANLIKALPGELAPFAGQFKKGGTCSAKLSDLHFVRRDRPSAATSPASGPASPQRDISWSADGTLAFDGAVVDIGQDAKTLTGNMAGTASRTAEGLMIDAQVDLNKIRVGPQEVSDFHSRVLKSARSPLVRLDQISAKISGGMMAGTAEIKLTDPMEYGIRLEVEDIDLDKLVNPGISDPAKKSKIQGKLAHGSVQYSARPGAKPAQQATGQLTIAKAKLGKLPVMLDLLHVLSFQLPGDSAFTDGDLKYVLYDNQLLLTEAYFTGPALSIVGSGRMDLKTEKLNMTFLTAPPGKLQRIAFLSDLAEALSRELTEFRVTGTLANPKMSTVAFRSLREIAPRLLEPGKDRD